MRRGEVDVSGGGIDVVVAHQRLQHGQVDAGLGQGGAVGYLYWTSRNAW